MYVHIDWFSPSSVLKPYFLFFVFIQVPGEPFRVDRTVDYISPGSMYAVIRGERYALNLKAIPKSSKSLIAA